MKATTIGERIRRRRESLKISRKELADAMGLAVSTIGDLEIGESASTKTLHRAAHKLRTSVEYLETGRGDPDFTEYHEPDWSEVRGYPQAVGLGASGIEANEYAEAHKLKFRASSLSRKRLQPDKLAVFYGKGDSMLPRIHDGDAVLFDTGDVAPKDGTLYVIQVPGLANAEYQVKRAMILDDVLFFAADNPSGDHQWTKPRRAEGKRGERIAILGRVRWIGSWED